MDNKEKLLDILSTVFDKKVDENCSSDNEILWDSIHHIGIIVTVEEEFGIRIPQEKIAELKSAKSLLEIINQLC